MEPIGHHQVDGDYRESWQPTAMDPAVWATAQDVAKRVVEACEYLRSAGKSIG